MDGSVSPGFCLPGAVDHRRQNTNCQGGETPSGDDKPLDKIRSVFVHRDLQSFDFDTQLGKANPHRRFQVRKARVNPCLGGSEFGIDLLPGQFIHHLEAPLL